MLIEKIIIEYHCYIFIPGIMENIEDIETKYVYDNLVKMMDYRRVILDEPPLQLDQFVEKINTNDMVTLAGKRTGQELLENGDTDPRGETTMMIVLIKPGSVYAGKSADFKKLSKVFPVGKNININIMFVSEEPLSTHIKKYLKQYKEDNPNVHIEDYDYKKFSTAVPESVMTPKHELINEEADKFCKQFFKNRDDFPKIPQNESMAVWLGLRPGMCVKVHRLSETAGIAISYRTCSIK